MSIALRRTLKILHTLASCGMVGALAGALVLLSFAPQDNLAAFADMRRSVAVLSEYILLPSLAAVVVSGLLAMAVHIPYLNKGWALAKAALGIVVFKGGLHVTGAHTAYAERIGDAAANGERLVPGMLSGALPYEEALLWGMLALSVANVVLGVWRPKFVRDQSRAGRPARKAAAATGRASAEAAE